MLRHSDIWQAIDRLAAEHGLTPSGLARRSGLDPTTFNKSKRITRDGKPRWPSTESVAKILEATMCSIHDFTKHFDDAPAPAEVRRIPVLGYAEAGSDGYFDDGGYPKGDGWDEIQFPNLEDPRVYALEITGDSMEPVYYEGDIIILSPAASIRRGDHVVLRTRDGEVMAKQLMRQTAHRIDLRSLNAAHPDRALAVPDVAWMARIMWSSH